MLASVYAEKTFSFGRNIVPAADLEEMGDRSLARTTEYEEREGGRRPRPVRRLTGWQWKADVT